MQRDHETGLVDPRQLLAHDLFVAKVHKPGAAVLLIRPGQQKTHLARLAPHAAIHHASLFPRGLMWHHLLVQEGGERVAKQFVLGVEMVALHGAVPPLPVIARRLGVPWRTAQ